MAYEVIRGGQGYSVITPQKGDIVIKTIKRTTSRGGSSTPETSVVIKNIKGGSGSEVLINGVGYSVIPGQTESFLKSKGLSGSSYQQALIQAQQLDQSYRQAEAQRQLELKRQAEEQKRIQDQILAENEIQEARLRKQVQDYAEAQRVIYNRQLQNEINKISNWNQLSNSIKQKYYNKYNQKYQGEINDYIKALGGESELSNSDKIINDYYTKLENKKSELDIAIEKGKLTIEEGQKIYDKFKETITNQVNSKLDNSNKITSVVSDYKPLSGSERLSGAILNFKYNQKAGTISLTKIKDYFKNIDLGLETWASKNKVKRDELYLATAPIREERNSKIEEVKSKLERDLKNSKSSKDRRNLQLEANRKIEKIKQDYIKNTNLLKNDLRTLGYSAVGGLIQSLGFYKDVIKLAGRSTTFSPALWISKNKTQIVDAIKKLGKKETLNLAKDSFNEVVTFVQARPGEAIILTGTTIITGSLEGKIFKPFSKIALRSIEGTINLGGKQIAKSTAISNGLKSIGNVLRAVTKKGENFIMLTGKTTLKSSGAKLSQKGIKEIGSIVGKRSGQILKNESILRQTRSGIERIIQYGEKNKINGIKVSKKEYQSYIKSLKDYLKNIKQDKKFTPIAKDAYLRIKNIVTFPINTRRIKLGTTLTKEESNLLKGALNLRDSKELMNFLRKSNLKYIDITQVTTKIPLDIPFLKRYITKPGTKNKLSEAIWRNGREEKTLYENIISYGFINDKGNHIISATYSTLSSKPLSRFRDLTNALKYGSGKRFIISRQAGKNFILSYSKDLDKRIIPKIKEYISKFDIKTLGNINTRTNPIKDIKVITKAIKGEKTSKDKFRKGLEVSRSRLLTQERKIKDIDNVKKNTIKLIKNSDTEIGGGLNRIERLSPDIDSSKLRNLIQKLEQSPQVKTKTNGILLKEKKIEELKKKAELIRKNYYKSSTKLRSQLSKTKDPIRIQNIKKQLDNRFSNAQTQLGNIGKRIVTINLGLKKDIKFIKNRISKNISRTSAQSQIGLSNIKTRKNIQGIKNLKKEYNSIKNYQKQVRELLKNKLISKTKANSLLASSRAFEQTLRNLSKSASKQRTKQLQKSLQKQKQALKQSTTQLQKSIQKQRSKSDTKTLLKLKTEIPLIIPTIIPPRIPKQKPPIREKIKRIPQIRLETTKRNRKILSKPTQLYRVYGKVKGKNILLSNRLTLDDARNFLAYEVDNKPIRSVVIKNDIKSKIARRIDKKYTNAFENKRNKLRQYKIQKKKAKAIRGYIEKRKYAFDRPGERIGRKITPSQRKVLLQRLKKARAVRMRNLKKRKV